MNKKPYEWILYLSVPFLVHGCVWFQNRGQLGYAAACAGTLTAASIWYYYFIKYRPMTKYRSGVAAVAISRGFEPLPDGEWQFIDIERTIRQFPGFDDTAMKLDTVYGRRERHLFSSIGRYAIGGTGINFGFFYLAIFNGDHTDMSADVIGGEVYAADDRRGPVIDPLLTAGLARLRYNWFVRGTVLLVDFDTREIKGDFLPTIRWVSEQVPTLCGAFTDDN